MGGWTRTPRRVAAAAAFAFLVASCSSPGNPLTSPAPTDGFSTSPHVTPSDSKSPAAKPKLSDPFKGLASYLAGRQGFVTAAVYDKNTNQLWEYNKGTLEYAASIVKVEILGTALWEAQRSGGQLPASQDSLARPMIEISDNNSASALLQAVGGKGKVAQFDQMAGLKDTFPHGTYPVIPGSPAPGWPGWGLTTTTAKDQVLLVKTFAYHNTLLTDAQRRYALNLMQHVVSYQRWGVSYGPTPGTTVALKNGWIPFPRALTYTQAGLWQINSIGWIHGHGRNYVLAVLTRNNPTMPYGEDTIQYISYYMFSQLRAPGR